MNYKEHTNCRVCGSDKLTEYLDLGELPLTNNLCENNLEDPQNYPLKVMLCMECGLSQLSIVVNPEILFGHYVYRSSINKPYVLHCRQMAKELQARYNLTDESFMIDIAGNDGALLDQFRKQIGIKILNIDPAKNLAAICQAKEILTLPYFWSEETAIALVQSGWGNADLITATNVFAHVDDVRGFMNGVRLLLKPTGALVLEFPYLIDFIDNNEFDCVYQEHLSYFMISPLVKLCKKVGFTVMDVEPQNIHGGTVRVHIGYGKQNESVCKYLDKESEYKTIEPYNRFKVTSYTAISDFRNKVYALTESGKKVCGFAASAKGNTLLNCAKITNERIRYIVDETPEKIGKYSPGTHIPIVSLLELQSTPPDYLVLLSWNFSDSLIEKAKSVGYTGKFIIPIPTFKVID